MPDIAWTDPTVLAFFVIPVALVALLVQCVNVASRRLDEPDVVRQRAMVGTVTGAAAWMAATWLVAERGLLLQWDSTPPAFAWLILSIVVLAVWMAFSIYGTRLALGLPIWVLVGLQGFRFPLELAMHDMYERGVMPQQMSYSGFNFDIVTGITALIVAFLLASGRGGRGLILGWNIVGFALLLNIVAIAILSTPRFAWFGAERLNTWVMYPPFVWLPAVMVLAALAGHLLIFRAAATMEARPRR